MTLSPLPVELSILCWSVVLLFVHISLQALILTKERGSKWNAGPRDGEMPKPGVMAGRAGRALDNFKETYPAFIAAVLVVAIAGRLGSWSQAGAWLWLLSRIVYIPLYLFGIAYVRSMVWAVSAVAIFLILFQLT